MLLAIAIATLVFSGGLFGLKPNQVHVRRAAVTALSAIALQCLLIAIVTSTRLDAWLHGLVYQLQGAIGVVAALETAGLWLPVVTVRWARTRARVATGFALYASSLIAASGFYYADDILEINGRVVSPSRIEYFFVLVACVLPVGLGYLGAWVVRELRTTRTTA